MKLGIIEETVLLGEIQNEDAFVKKEAVHVLGEIEMKEPQILTVMLLSLLKDENPDVRSEVIQTLKKLQVQDSPIVVAEIINLLKHQDWQVRLTAINAISELGINVKDHLSIVASLLQEERQEIKIAAAKLFSANLT